MFGNLDQKIEEKKQVIEILDWLDELFGLEEEEIIRRNQVTT